jgi:20S proteasome subunit beta 2
MAADRIRQHAFKYGGHVGIYSIVGGFDVKGPQLMEVSADGNMYSLPFLTMGSGSLPAMAIMETQYREDMN